MAQDTSGAAAVLGRLGIRAQTITQWVERLAPRNPVPPRGKPALTPRTKKVIEQSVEVTRSLSHTRIGTEHLLLGLLGEEEGIAAEVLKNAGLELRAARTDVLRQLGSPNIGSDAPAKEAT